MNRDDEENLTQEAQAHDDLESQDWWQPGEPWWNQPQDKLRAWHDEVTKHFKRG